MGESDKALTGPDLGQGIEESSIRPGGSLLGHFEGDAVLLVRDATGDAFAIGATCTHYSGPLAEGRIEGHTVRCPWHHACFDLRTGEALEAPALNPVACWRVERHGSKLVLGGRITPPVPPAPPASPESVVIVGAGAAGNAAAEMLRREGYRGPVVLIGAEPTPPVDRPNLSKDYLAGIAPEEWVTLRPVEFYAERDIELLRDTRVTAIDPNARTVALSDGATRAYGALLLVTGAEPVRLTVPGAESESVFTLRTLADSRAIIARATSAGVSRVVVIGASFIGLEAAASLRERGLEVHVVGREARPLERILGPEIADFVRALHEEHGVRFHLGRSASAIEPDAVVLDDGSSITADLVVAGIGVRPALALAEQAGLTIDRGVVVDEYLETSVRGIYAAGDIARHPGAHGERWRIEHWVVAERQGQAAARNILGHRRAHTAAPFFWSQHYDVPIAYVGHAESWDRVEVRGSVADGDCLVALRNRGRIDAIVTIHRDAASLEAESLFERQDQLGLEALMARG